MQKKERYVSSNPDVGLRDENGEWRDIFGRNPKTHDLMTSSTHFAMFALSSWLGFGSYP
jgi:hypothetical protein